MRKKPYTKEEIKQLEANPHTLQATAHRMQLTMEAKGFEQDRVRAWHKEVDFHNYTMHSVEIKIKT